MECLVFLIVLGLLVWGHILDVDSEVILWPVAVCSTVSGPLSSPLCPCFREVCGEHLLLGLLDVERDVCASFGLGSAMSTHSPECHSAESSHVGLYRALVPSHWVNTAIAHRRGWSASLWYFGICALPTAICPWQTSMSLCSMSRNSFLASLLKNSTMDMGVMPCFVFRVVVLA